MQDWEAVSARELAVSLIMDVVSGLDAAANVPIVDRSGDSVVIDIGEPWFFHCGTISIFLTGSLAGQKMVPTGLSSKRILSTSRRSSYGTFLIYGLVSVTGSGRKILGSLTRVVTLHGDFFSRRGIVIASS